MSEKTEKERTKSENRELEEQKGRDRNRDKEGKEMKRRGERHKASSNESFPPPLHSSSPP